MFSLLQRCRSAVKCRNCIDQLSIIRGQSSIVNRLRKKTVPVDLTKYKPIFRYRQISAHLFILKLRYAALGFGGLVIPFTALTGTLTHTALVCFLSSLQYGLLHVYSKVFSNVIGIAYVSKDEKKADEVLLALVTPSGSRHNVIHKIDDLRVLGFANNVMATMGFVSIGIADTGTKYLMSIRKSQIFDNEAVESIFGVVVGEQQQQQKKKQQPVSKR